VALGLLAPRSVLRGRRRRCPGLKRDESQVSKTHDGEASRACAHLSLVQTEREEGASQHPPLSITWTESSNSVMRPEMRSKTM
jgi:hypothetical protein